LSWYDYGARWYDAVVGQWWQVDPLGEKRFWASVFTYVQNNPLGRIDPTGRLDDPIFDAETGEFLGHYGDEDFEGEIMLMTRENYMTMTGGEDVIVSYELAEEYGRYLSDYIANEFELGDLSDEFLLSSVFVSLIDKANEEGVTNYDSNQLDGGRFRFANFWEVAFFEKGKGGDVITINVHPVSLEEYREGQYDGGTQSLFYLTHAGNAISILSVHEPLHRFYPGDKGHRVIYPVVKAHVSFQYVSEEYRIHVEKQIEKWGEE